MGLDIYVRRLEMPSDEEKTTTFDEREIHERHPGCSLVQFDDLRTEPPDFPRKYLFTAKFRYTSFEKLFKKHSTPERPLKWGPEWHFGGEGTSPFRIEEKELDPECEWWLFFHKKGPDDKEPVDRVCLPGDEKGAEGCTIEEVHPCFMYENVDLGYMRKGANGQFYEDMQAGRGSSWVFSKKILDEYARKYFDTRDDDYYGNARAYFREHIQKPFGDGKGKLVRFWY